MLLLLCSFSLTMTSWQNMSINLHVYHAPKSAPCHAAIAFPTELRARHSSGDSQPNEKHLAPALPRQFALKQGYQLIAIISQYVCCDWVLIIDDDQNQRLWKSTLAEYCLPLISIDLYIYTPSSPTVGHPTWLGEKPWTGFCKRTTVNWFTKLIGEMWG